MGRTKNLGLTEREKAIVQFFKDFQAAHLGCPPSDREIMRAVGISSTSVVRYHLNDRLGSMGVLKTVGDKGDSRKWVLADGKWSCDEQSVAE
jgi:hypothetical protein